MKPREAFLRGIQAEIPYFSEPLPRAGRPASVIALFAFPQASARQDWREASLLLTRRTETVETHKGQIAFPGGHQDPEDRDEVDVALREMEEEVGITRSAVDVVGPLPPLWTRTGYLVTPVLGLLAPAIEETGLRPSPEEIAEVFWAPVRQLLAPEFYAQEVLVVEGRSYPIHAYQVGPHRVWGVTGCIIRNILERVSASHE